MKAVTGKKAVEYSEMLIHPLVSEKTVGQIESQNKISFIVRKNATKTDIREAVEGLYAVKVTSIRVQNDSKGKKRAVVKLHPGFPAQELATKLGVI